MIKEYLLTDLDKQVLNRIQYNFPISEDPYGVLAIEFDIDRSRVYNLICNLRHEGIIRRIGASFNSAKLGYSTVLAAAEVVPSEISSVAEDINRFSEVTHNYQRDDKINLWFTIISPSYDKQHEIIDTIKNKPGVANVYTFPACEIYKLKVDFCFRRSYEINNSSTVKIDKIQPSKACVLLNYEVDKVLIARLGGDIDFSMDPYGRLAFELGVSREYVLNQLYEYKKKGIMRRFGSILQHQAAGFIGNGMTVWSIPDSIVDKVGHLFAKQINISHCYRRKPCKEWQFNLYAMVHGHDNDYVRNLCMNLSSMLEINNYKILFSLREFKKSSMIYFSEYL